MKIISSFLFFIVAYTSTAENVPIIINHSFKKKEIEIPFTNLNTKRNTVNIYISDIRKKANIFLKINDTVKINFFDRLPIKVIELKDGNICIFTRKIFQNGFNSYLFNFKTKKIEEIKIPNFFRENGYFREAFCHENNVFFINYNRKSYNDSQGGDRTGDINKIHRLVYEKEKFYYDKFFAQTLTDKNFYGGKTIYGIDQKFLNHSYNENYIICSASECQKLDIDPSKDNKTYNFPENYYLLELAGNSNSLFALLANSKMDPNQYIIYDVYSQKIYQKFFNKIPYKLNIEKDGFISYKTVNKKNIADFLKYKIEKSKDSGLLEMGMNNYDARISWSQIYYLNGFLDIVAKKTSQEFHMLPHDFKKKIKQRLKIEMNLLDSYLHKNIKNYYSARYSTNVKLKLYAVQTGRILRLMTRYQNNFNKLLSYNKIKKYTDNLIDHEETIYKSGKNDIDSLPEGRISLKWNKGVDFPFDGIKVPFNHQDDWISGVIYSNFLIKNKDTDYCEEENEYKKKIAQHIILTLLEYSEIQKATLEKYEWQYWYGRISHKWDKEDCLSQNTPQYGGFKGPAHITYQTIDVMALLTVAAIHPKILSNKMMNKIIMATRQGKLLPFVQEDLIDLHKKRLHLFDPVINYYSACSEAWCLENVIWAIKDFEWQGCEF